MHLETWPHKLWSASENVEGKEFCSKIKWKEDYDSRKEHQAENQTCKHFTKETMNLVWNRILCSDPRVLLLWLLYMGFLAVMGCPDVKFLRFWAVDVFGWYIKLGTHALPIGPGGIGPLTAEDQARSHWWKQACKSNKICCKQSLEIDIAIFFQVQYSNQFLSIYIYIYIYIYILF